jgi:hypothetical protein
MSGGDDIVFIAHSKTNIGNYLGLDRASLQHTMFPFYLRGKDHKLLGIRRMEVVDDSGQALRGVDFPGVAHLASGKTVIARAAAVYLDDPIIQKPTNVVLNYYAPKLYLKICGESLSANLTCLGELVQQDWVIACRPLTGASRFTWVAALRRVKPDLPLIRLSDVSSVSWKVNRITLSRDPAELCRGGSAVYKCRTDRAKGGRGTCRAVEWRLSHQLKRTGSVFSLLADRMHRVCPCCIAVGGHQGACG